MSHRRVVVTGHGGPDVLEVIEEEGIGRRCRLKLAEPDSSREAQASPHRRRRDATWIVGVRRSRGGRPPWKSPGLAVEGSADSVEGDCGAISDDLCHSPLAAHLA